MRSTAFRAAVATAALLFALPACAQPAPQAAPADADPALWVVKDDDTTVYLFGTVHVLKPGLTWFDEAVKTAFDRSDTLVMELVAGDPAADQQLVMAKGMTRDGPTLSEQLPAGKRAAFAAAIAGTGIPQPAVERMRPWLASITLSQAPIGKLGYDAANGPETVLAAAAKTAGKPVVGLESTAEQLGIFDGLSQPAQIALLESTVDELPKAGETMARMVGSWSTGDPRALAGIMNESLKDSPEVAKALLYDRNARWATWIAERMKAPGTVFVAVGAGHLAGRDSVQERLAPMKLRAVRVKY